MKIFFVLMVFLFPVAIYCSILAVINRRSQSLMISGPWDFAGLLFAASGFLLAVGPVLLASFYRESVQRFFLQGDGKDFPPGVIDVLGNWTLYLILYYGLVVCGSAALLWWRKKNTVIYNIPADLFEDLFFGILNQHQIPWHRRGKRVFLGVPRAAAALPQTAQQVKGTEDERITGEAELLSPPAGPSPAGPSTSTNQGIPGEPSGNSYVEVDPFPLFNNVTLAWHGPAARELRPVIETDLEKTLETVYIEDNPVAGWFLGFSGLLFLIMIFSTGMVILFHLMTRP